MFKAPLKTDEWVLTTGRVLPSSSDIEAFLNNPQLGASDEPFRTMSIDYLNELLFIAKNQNRWRNHADVYRSAIEHLEALNA